MKLFDAEHLIHKAERIVHDSEDDTLVVFLDDDIHITYSRKISRSDWSAKVRVVAHDNEGHAVLAEQRATSEIIAFWERMTDKAFSAEETRQAELRESVGTLLQD